MEKEKIQNIQKEFNENKNNFIQSKYTNSNTDPKDEMFYQNSNINTFINSLNINGVRSYMANNNIINENDPLLTEIYKNNVSSKGNESFGSSNYDLVMNQNYNYNPQTSNNNSSIKTAEINSPNYLYTSNKEYSHQNPGNSNNYQYYSEQKVFNPNNILFNNSTKKSTRSTGTKGDVQENHIKVDINENGINKNNDNDNNNNNCVDNINNVGRSSLTKMINECYENNDNDIEDDNELNSNRKDNKMTMNSFDSSQKNYRTNNNSHENENTLDEDGEEEEQNDLSDNNINSLKEKSMNSEKMNFNNEEMCYLLNGNKLNSEYQDSQISDYNIQSKSNQNQSQNDNKEKNVIKSNNNINNNSQLSQNRNKNKNMNVKVKKDINKNQKLPQLKNNNIKNDLYESHPDQHEIGNKNNKNQFSGKIPFQGNYFEYKKYEKYILDNEELLNNGDEEDVFGNYVDSIIKKSYHVYTNRQCSTCAKLLTKGKSCIHCPKYHHTLKSQRNQKIKNNGK